MKPGLLLLISTLLEGETIHHLPATPTTVIVGNYFSGSTPVLTIASGDTVEIECVSVGNAAKLEAAGAMPADIKPAIRALEKQVKDRGPGGHPLTGPVFIEGAQPGDVLEVRIRRIEMTEPYAFNSFGPKSGFLKEDFPYSKTRIIPLDQKRGVAVFGKGIEIPLRPFFGSMGVAPPESMGKINSAPPGIHAGNMDNRDLVAGTTLFIPVHVKGALFQVGDGHAGQGNGEVDITAMETSLTGTFQFIVRKDMHLTWPRAETPTQYIAIGINEDLTEAARLATREMIDFLVKEKGLTRDDAYALISVAGDLNVTQVVDGTKGVHVTLAKSLFGH